MLILICRIGNRLEYLPEACRIRFHTYVTNGAFEDHIGLAGVDCGSSGSAGMLHLFYLMLHLSYLLPFFEENWISSIGSHLKVNLVGPLELDHQ